MPHDDPDHVLVLRTVNKEGKSYRGFQWPLTPGATIEAPDWDPAPRCGRGLHGFLWGEGFGCLASWKSDAIWLVLRVRADQIVDLGGKVKFPRATVVYAGDRQTATQLIVEARPGAAVIGASTTAGHHGTATAGYHGTATAGDGGEIRIRWWDYEADRCRTAVGYAGEDGIEPNVAYRVNSQGGFVKA